MSQAGIIATTSTAAATRKSEPSTRAASLAAQRLERGEHERVRQGPPGERLGQDRIAEGLVIEGHRDRIDARRAERGEDREPDRHPDHARRPSPLRSPCRTPPDPAASTAAADRGVTVSPKPNPNEREAGEAAARRGVIGREPREHDEPDDPGDEPDHRHGSGTEPPHREAGDSGPDGHRQGERAKDGPLLVGPGEEHAVDERGHADDDRRERVAGQHAHEHGRAEHPVAEETQVEERRRHAAHADDRERPRRRPRRRSPRP